MPKNPKKHKESKLSPSKKQHIFHSQKRAAQRFGLALTPEEILNIGKLIRKGSSKYLGSQSRTRTHHLVNYMGKEMVIVYDKKNKVPITILFARRSDRHGIRKENPQESE